MAAPRRLILAPSAAHDLEGIYLAIAEDDPAAARKQVTRILGAAERLRQFPESGRARPRLAAGLRSIVEGSYVVFYFPREDRIEVVRVLHTRRDMEREMWTFITKRLRP